MPFMKYLIAGLGNIGAEYEDTRHNIGFSVVEHLCKTHEASFVSDRLAAVATVKHKGRTFICIKPATYMNLSGKAVQYWLQKEQISPANLMVVTDDISLPLGKLRIRGKGSDGGHNGLKNIIEVLGTDQYPRMRIGIGNEYARGRQADFVLGKWKPEEVTVVNEKIVKACEAILSFGFIGLERTMNQYNG